uniref:Uncharacterized protein n=1 Tax=Salix viminalis TaxID=40686 RepID=A0A6N2KS60_SALVM
MGRWLLPCSSHSVFSPSLTLIWALYLFVSRPLFLHFSYQSYQRGMIRNYLL